MCLVRADGRLEIYSLPDMQQRFAATDIHLGHRLLSSNGHIKQEVRCCFFIHAQYISI